MAPESRFWTKKRRNIAFISIVVFTLLCIFAALKPPSSALIEQIPKSFVENAGKRYVLSEQDFFALNIVRGKDMKSGESYTFIGMAKKIFAVPPKGFFAAIANILLWLPSLIAGTRITIALTIASVAAGVVGSVFLALGKISRFKPLSAACSAYIFFFRGTPLLMQLFFVYYGLPTISRSLAINNKFLAAFIAFGLNSAAYCAEIIRAAIQSIDKGQFEAAQTLGHSYAQTMRLIIMPQSFRRLIPPIANEFIMVLKDASLVAIIALQDLTQTTRSIQSSSASVLVYIPAMCIYLIITAFFTALFTRLERRFSIYQ